MKDFLKKMMEAGLYDDPSFTAMWNAICEAAEIKSYKAKPALNVFEEMVHAARAIAIENAEV